jgi:hypothetical protein
VTPEEYEQLPPEEKEHFATCSECGEIFDRRSLDEVLFHFVDHKPRPDIQYSGRRRTLAVIPHYPANLVMDNGY